MGVRFLPAALVIYKLYREKIMDDKKSWYLYHKNITEPDYFRVCRPYLIEYSKISLTDEEILTHYGSEILEVVLAEETAWNKKWGGLTSAEAMLKSRKEKGLCEFSESWQQWFPNGVPKI